MAKSPTAQGKAPNVELRPDGWQQFERAVDAAVKSGPKHRSAKAKPEKRTAEKGRARVGKARS
jgi:hypothetical protein